jgi:hypothetical protein
VKTEQELMVFDSTTYSLPHTCSRTQSSKQEAHARTHARKKASKHAYVQQQRTHTRTHAQTRAHVLGDEQDVCGELVIQAVCQSDAFRLLGHVRCLLERALHDSARKRARTGEERQCELSSTVRDLIDL